MTVKKKKPSSFFTRERLRKAWRITRKAAVWFFIISFAWVLLYRWVNPPITWLMVQRGIERKIDGKPWKIEKDWIPIDELPETLQRAAIAGEDINFRQHWGFDIEAIKTAYSRNKNGRRMRGGSTISQQTAKNVFLWPGRSWIRKGFEVYFTGLIELLWSKERILEVYLNVIETGDGLYGVNAAAVNFFNVPAQKLGRSQSALIIAVLPNPRRWSPAKPTRYIYYKQGLILRNMRRMKKVRFD